MVRCLGEGAIGVVYEALDRDRGTRVAIKTLRKVSDEARARFEHEFRALQDIRHPNLVALGELIHDHEQSFLTMELVEGINLLEYVRAPNRKPMDAHFDEQRLRDSLRQLAEALSVLHEAGLVHRDVKPSNVRVTREGRVVLLDFGLVIDVAENNPWTEGAGGTPAYMAPEQALSASVGPEADWYALGVLLYEALTGRVPFEGAPLHVMMCKQKEEPSAPRALCRDIPADLDALCAALLRFDPVARPRGRHVLRALGSRDAALGRYTTQTQETPFVGRAEELALLRAALRESRTGHPVTVVIEGPSGVGKTALAERFAQGVSLEDPEAVVLAGRCYAEDLRPFQGVTEIVESLVSFLRAVDGSEADGLVPAKPLPLVKMFPALRRVEAIMERSRGSAQPSPALVGHRTRAFEGLRELLARVSEGRSVVMFLDDADEIDADSLALLAELVRPPGAPKLLVVLATQRPPPALPGVVRRLSLAPFSLHEGQALAAALLERVESDDPAAAERLARCVAGDPLAIEMTALHWAHAPDLTGGAPERHIIGSLVTGLDEVARLVLETTAVASAPLGADVLERVAGVSKQLFRQSVSMLRILHLVRSTGGRTGRNTGPESAERIDAYHERVRAAVFASLSEPRRAEIHRSIAIALEMSQLPDLSGLAIHWGGAGNVQQMAHYAGLAAGEAVERLAFGCAARLYERALSGERSSEERKNVLVKLGEARAHAGLGRDASDAFALAADEATGSEGLDLRRRAAEELLMIGDIEGGTRKLRDVAARIGIWMPSSAITTVVGLFLFRVALWIRGMRFALRGMRFALREEESIPAHEVTRIWTSGGVARVLSVINAPLAKYFHARMLLFALRAGSAYGLAYALAFEAAWVAAKGVRTRDRTDRLLSLADQLAQRSGVPRALGSVTAYHAYVAFSHGLDVESKGFYERSIEFTLDRATSGISVLRHIQIASLITCAALGDLQEVSVQLRSLVRDAMDRGDVTVSTNARIFQYLWRGWLRDGDSREVRAAIEEAMGRLSRGRYPSQQHWANGALAEMDLYDGRGREAFERVARDFPRARRARRFIVERVHVVARERRARCAILAASQETRPSERARLLRVARRDARWLRSAPPDYAKPWGDVVEAGVCSVQGDRAGTVAALERAIEGLDRAHDRFAAACVRMRLGALLGSADAAGRGRAILEAGEAFMRAQGVKDPHRLAAGVVPGILA
jgi:hypothetical protein